MGTEKEKESLLTVYTVIFQDIRGRSLGASSLLSSFD